MILNARHVQGRKPYQLAGWIENSTSEALSTQQRPPILCGYLWTLVAEVGDEVNFADLAVTLSDPVTSPADGRCPSGQLTNQSRRGCCRICGETRRLRGVMQRSQRYWGRATGGVTLIFIAIVKLSSRNNQLKKAVCVQ